MTAVYSRLLIAVQGLSTAVVELAPADRLVVLRCFDAYWGGGTTGSPSIRLVGSADQTIVEFHATAEDPAGAIDSHSWHWEGRQIINPGEPYAVIATGPPADVSLSGYELSLPF